MTKKEALRNVYPAQLWDAMDDDGFIYSLAIPGYELSHRDYFGLMDANIETKAALPRPGYLWRTDEARQVVENNGWITIKSKEDLPASFTSCMVVHKPYGRISNDIFNPEAPNIVRSWLKKYSHWKVKEAPIWE